MKLKLYQWWKKYILKRKFQCTLQEPKSQFNLFFGNTIKVVSGKLDLIGYEKPMQVMHYEWKKLLDVQSKRVVVESRTVSNDHPLLISIILRNRAQSQFTSSWGKHVIWIDTAQYFTRDSFFHVFSCLECTHCKSYLPKPGCSSRPFNFWTSFALLRLIEARSLEKEPLRFSFPVYWKLKTQNFIFETAVLPIEPNFFFL